jgi:peroxiredoxin Q/BCP
MLKVGTLAPDFDLVDESGTIHKLSDYKGQKIVLYFYPKDNTPGCTKEACSFRDNFSDMEKFGIKVFGVSKDGQKSHLNFKSKYELPFTLLSDPEKIVIEDYDALKEPNKNGKQFVKRITYVIDEKGVIEKVYPKVNTATHAEDILNDLA